MFLRAEITMQQPVINQSVYLVMYNFVWSSIFPDDPLLVKTSRNHVFRLESVLERRHESVERMPNEHELEVVRQSVLDLLRRVTTLIITTYATLL